MSGEGTGGSFRAYRGDIGYVFDHKMRTKDESGMVSIDLGFGDLFHAGTDFSYTRAFTESGAWKMGNPMASAIAFTKSDKNYEAVYFRNPGEKAVNSKAFYNAIGGEDVVVPKLFQVDGNSPVITTTNYLTRYRNKKEQGVVQLSAATAVKQERDKRTQVISYLTAAEASTVGFSKYIDNYSLNKYQLGNCNNTFSDDIEGPGVGLKGEIFNGREFEQRLYERIDTSIIFNRDVNTPYYINLNRPSGAPEVWDNFSARWTGRLKADVTATYTIYTLSDDGAKVSLNGQELINNWYEHPGMLDSAKVNLEAGEFYDIKVEYNQFKGDVTMVLEWRYLSTPRTRIPTSNLYLMPAKDTFSVNDTLSKQKRVNRYRKANHISEINVLNADGRRYVYGLPVYNLKQKEVTFSVKHENGNAAEGTVGYNSGTDDSKNNKNGNDWYYNSEEMPAYAHAFLLTGVVSPDYVDLTGNGISDDDPGDAVKFNYTQTAGPGNPYKWRTPYSNKASYNEGLKTDNRDDKGSYVYGEKELWYLNSIESKNMIAVFKLENRHDLAPIDESGVKDTSNHAAKRLKEINLYTKADFLKYNTAATPVKTVHFEYTYDLCKGINDPRKDTGKLTLKRIWFTYNGNKKGRKNAYVFNYNANNPDFDHKSFDRWGNYKDPLQNPGSSAGNLITNADYPYALQDSTTAALNAAAWTLDSITLPSGGRIKVAYESDDYAYVQHRRAGEMFKIAGFSKGIPVALNSLSNKLYGESDYLYVGINVSQPVASKAEVLQKYLEGLEKIHFRLNVKMPTDKFGRGSDYVSCYGKVEVDGYGKIVEDSYGFINSGNTIWIKLVGVGLRGEDGGEYSPLAKAAAQFLRLNLPSKAYPGSDVGDNLKLEDGVKVLLSLSDNIRNALSSFDAITRDNEWVKYVDLTRSAVRLNNPGYKKYGGGLRVKKVIIYDHWNAMTGQKESMYGTLYDYTTIKNINGVDTEISSGVAAYEPILGGEENPWHEPLEYTEQVAALAPTNMGYVEVPLGESFFPAASVGYSQVRTRSIKTKNTRSANGYEETRFYTAYDFPTIVDHTLLNKDTKLRFKPRLGNFLRINAIHHLVMSQGFKVELNDMHGKTKSHAVYGETDKVNPIAYKGYYYRVDDQNSEFKHLKNTVPAIDAKGKIDTAAVVGQDIELMMDMREQKFLSNSANLSINADFFSFGVPPVMAIGSGIPLPQREENLLRTAAATKIINRHGILDSMVVIDKGSKVVTHNLLYDGETGEVVLTATQNEFEDSIFNFKYPAGWVYDGMSGAYKNINTVLDHINIKEGRITNNLSPAAMAAYFSSGDELLVFTKNEISGDGCDPVLATFPRARKIWAVDANVLNGGTQDIYFMDENGAPFTDNDMTMKVIRSGRKNIAATIGGVTMMKNPLVNTGNTYNLVINKDSKIIEASVVEYKQNWQVEDRKKQQIKCAYEQ